MRLKDILRRHKNGEPVDPNLDDDSEARLTLARQQHAESTTILRNVNKRGVVVARQVAAARNERIQNGFVETIYNAFQGR